MNSELQSIAEPLEGYGLHGHALERALARDKNDSGDVRLKDVQDELGEPCECSLRQIKSLADAVLPGHGKVLEGCGDPLVLKCRCCGRRWTAFHHCLRRECPTCFGPWAHKEAVLASWRIWAGSKMIIRENHWSSREFRISHCWVSIPDKGQDIDYFRRAGIQVLKKHGFLGGCLIVHPFRVDPETGAYWRDGYVHLHAMALVRGEWTEGGTDGKILFGVIKDPSSTGEEPRFRGFHSDKELRKAIHYALKHCGIVEGRHALTWWGCFSRVSFPDQKLKERYPTTWDELHAGGHVCPECGSRDVDVTRYRLMDGSYVPVTPPDPAYRRPCVGSTTHAQGACPICGFLTFGRGDSDYGICPVCGIATNATRRNWSGGS